MATRDKPEGWLEIIQHPRIKTDDLKLVKFLLRDLAHYVNGGQFEREDTEKLLALMTAIRIDQMGKTAAEIEGKETGP